MFLQFPVGGSLEAECSARVRLATTALAIERFRLAQGRLPENLNGLTPQFLSAVPSDPFDGASLRYHRLAKSYVIYSVGRDGHDNGGREQPSDAKSSDKAGYDITFTVER
jgi:type II secretory pathway pseudopilin PulG